MATNEAIAHFINSKEGLTPDYIYCYLSCFDYSSLGSTSSIATAVNSKIIKAMPILNPDAEPLSLFSQTTAEWFNSIASHSQQLETLTKLRDTLLPKLISGELRISDAEQLTEEALA
jgi:type I restriction enzyme S subunit